MRKCLLISAALALAAGLSLVSVSIQATPVTVDISGCGGSAICTSDGVIFSGWQFNGTATDPWTNTALTYKSDPNNETGLGVACTGGKCSEKEIDGTPAQLIAVELSHINFSSLSLDVGSVDCDGSAGCGAPEIAYIYASTCADPALCGYLFLDSYSGHEYPLNSHTFTFTLGDLAGNDFLWVTPLSPNDNGSANSTNFLLESLTYTSVPEPGALGMFGIGAMLIGLFDRLRRRLG